MLLSGYRWADEREVAAYKSDFEPVGIPDFPISTDIPLEERREIYKRVRNYDFTRYVHTYGILIDGRLALPLHL